MTRAKRTGLAVVLGILFVAAIGLGIHRDEIPDVIARATIICYSCIGIK